MATLLALPLLAMGYVVFLYDAPPPDETPMKLEGILIEGLDPNPLEEFVKRHAKGIRDLNERESDRDVDRSQDLDRDVWNLSALQDLIRPYDKVLEEFRELPREAPLYWHPKATEISNQDFDFYASPVQLMALAATHEIRVNLLQSHHSEAVENAVDLARVAHELSRAEGTLLEWLVAHRVSRLATQAQFLVLQYGQGWNAERLHYWRQSYASSLLRSEDFAGHLRVEYLFFRNSIDRQDVSRFLNKPNISLAETIADRAPLITALDTSWASALPFERQFEDDVVEREAAQWRRRLSINGIGFYEKGRGDRTLIRLFEASRELLSLQRTLLLAVDLRLHELRTGSLPSSVADLRPAADPSERLDPFTDGNSLRWDLNRGRIFSVGADGTDDGGDIELPIGTQGDDVGIRYPWSPKESASK